MTNFPHLKGSYRASNSLLGPSEAEEGRGEEGRGEEEEKERRRDLHQHCSPITFAEIAGCVVSKAGPMPTTVGWREMEKKATTLRLPAENPLLPRLPTTRWYKHEEQLDFK